MTESKRTQMILLEIHFQGENLQIHKVIIILQKCLSMLHQDIYRKNYPRHSTN